MNDAAPARDLSLAGPPRRLDGIHALAVKVASDRLTAVLAVLLVGVWCSEGLLELAGLPHRAILLVDLAEVLLCLWLGARLVLRRPVPRMPVLVGAYVLWIVVGLATHAQPAAVLTALKSLVLLPVLAVLVASRATTERRANVLVATLLALGAFEFLLTLGQSFRFSDSDAIVGSFGPFSNAAVGAVILMTACVALAGYLVQAPYGKACLAGAALLPLFAAWAFVKFVPVALPVVTVAVVLPALASRRATWRRALVSVVVATLSSGLVLASYAAFSSDSFAALVGSRARENYLQSASISSGTAVQQRAQMNGVVVGSYWNASVTPTAVSPSARAGFWVSSVSGADYTAFLAASDGADIRVEQNRPYVFSAVVAGAYAAAGALEVQIEWRTAAGNLVGTALGKTVALQGTGGGYQRLVVSGVAPAGAVSALPKIAVTGTSRPGSAIVVEALRFRRGTATLEGLGAHQPLPHGPLPPPPASVVQPSGAARPVPGRLTQWRMAEHAISGSYATKLFGKGLGSATVAENLGVHPLDLSADAAAASYSDFGTLLVERGWTGIAIVALFAAALTAAAFRIARALPPLRWTTALTLAIPGVVCVMATYGMIADQLRNRPAALTFWLIVALGLSPGAFLAERPRGHGPSRGRETLTPGAGASRLSRFFRR